MSKVETPVKAAKVKKPSIFKKIAAYFKELRSEVRKVIWPTKKQIINNTIVVVVAIIVIGAFVMLLDFLFGGLISLILGNAA